MLRMVALKTKNKYIFPSVVEYGNVIAERDGAKAENPQVYRPYYQDGDLYWTDYGFGVVRPNAVRPDDGIYQRNYRWNERNLLSESSDSVYTVHYRYGADGQRAIKYVSNSRLSTLHFNKMWQTNSLKTQSKHIFVGETRIATKHNTEGNNNTEAERRRIYYYHSDHLGSAQTITNYNQVIHERLEYTPYGELWIDWKSANSTDTTPFRFTGKELDKETGLYYYGARYLDPKTSRWLGVDPAIYEGDYLPSAPINDEARKRNQNLPGNGGIFNSLNFHVYGYTHNNPVRYIDPDGKWIAFKKQADHFANLVREIATPPRDIHNPGPRLSNIDVLRIAEERERTSLYSSRSFLLFIDQAISQLGLTGTEAENYRQDEIARYEAFKALREKSVSLGDFNSVIRRAENEYTNILSRGRNTQEARRQADAAANKIIDDFIRERNPLYTLPSEMNHD